MQKKYKYPFFNRYISFYIFHLTQKSEKISFKVILNLILFVFFEKYITLIINNK